MSISAHQVKALRERTGAGLMDCKRALMSVNGDLEQAILAMRKSGQALADKKSNRIAAEGVVLIRITEDKTQGTLVEVNCETDFVTKQRLFLEFAHAVAECVLRTAPADLAALGTTPTVMEDQPITLEAYRHAMISKMGENIHIRRFRMMRAKNGGQVAGYVHNGSYIGVLLEMTGGNKDCAHDIAMHIAASSPLAIDKSGIPSETLAKEREIFRARAADSNKPAAIQEKMIDGQMEKYMRQHTLLGQPFIKDADQSVAQVLRAASATVTDFARFEVGEGQEKRSDNFVDEVMAQAQGKG